jgi:hypothetical protein
MAKPKQITIAPLHSGQFVRAAVADRPARQNVALATAMQADKLALRALRSRGGKVMRGRFSMGQTYPRPRHLAYMQFGRGDTLAMPA